MDGPHGALMALPHRHRNNESKAPSMNLCDIQLEEDGTNDRTKWR
jgi:hypothetical protein